MLCLKILIVSTIKANLLILPDFERSEKSLNRENSVIFTCLAQRSAPEATRAK